MSGYHCQLEQSDGFLVPLITFDEGGPMLEPAAGDGASERPVPGSYDLPNNDSLID